MGIKRRPSQRKEKEELKKIYNGRQNLAIPLQNIDLTDSQSWKRKHELGATDERKYIK